jgi:plastocyanin
MKTLSLTLNPKLLLLVLAGFLPFQAVYAQSVSGHIEIEGQSSVKKIIVYLSPDQPRQQQSQTYQVSQKDTRFRPPLTVITVGDKVQWVNDEAREIDHNIYSLSEISHFDLGLGAKGSKLEHTFNRLGEVNYYCSVHKSMEGKIVVLPSRYYQILEQPGDFKLEAIPEGKWLLNAVIFHRRYKVEPVSITVDKTAAQNLTLKLVKR